MVLTIAGFMGAMVCWFILGIGADEGEDDIEGRYDGIYARADGMSVGVDEGSVDNEGSVGTVDFNRDV